MKRFFTFALLACFLLTAGCGKPAVDKEPSPAPSAPAAAEPAAPTTQDPAAKPAASPSAAPAITPEETPSASPEPSEEPEPETQTMYLLEEVVFSDSGYMNCYYDADYNIASYSCYTIENNPYYDVFFEEPDANRMPCKVRTVWADGTESGMTLSYFEDGKLDSILEDGLTYTGCQYEYDLKGDMIEKREYYEGILQYITYYVYDGETLLEVYCEDAEGTLICETWLENGLPGEEIYYDDGILYGNHYEYDENGNVLSRTFWMGAEELGMTQYYYMAVEVPVERVAFVESQQYYLRNHI